jgi:hypothetical protein
VSAIQEQIGKQANIVTNFSRDIFAVPADLLRLRLRDFEAAVGARWAWGVPATLALGCLGNLMTLKSGSEITLLGLNRDTWVGISSAGLVLCMLATVALIIRALLKRKDGSVEAIVNSLRPEATPPLSEK